jgi:hypothetical protein
MSDTGPFPAMSPAALADGRVAVDEDSAPSYEGWARWIAALVAALLGALMLPGPLDFALDDAWIHLAYAKSLRLGDGLSYNPGDHELGASSPLWALVLAAWPIEGDPVRPVQLLGILLHALTAWIAAQLGMDLARRRATVRAPLPVLSLTLLCGVLVAASPTLVQASVSGMEVGLCAALVLAVAWAMIQGHVAPAGVLAVLAVAARPEALGFVLALAGVLVPWRWRAGERRASVRAPLHACAGALASLGAWLLYCRLTGGQWWPNAQYVKGQGGGPEGLHYLAEQVLPWQPWLVSLTGVVLLGLALHGELRPRRPARERTSPDPDSTAPAFRDPPDDAPPRRPELLALAIASVATLVAIACSRPLDPALGFYQSRYFIPFCAPLVVVLPFGLPRSRRVLALALALPLAVVTGLQIRALQQASLAQRSDTATLHGAVARFVADELPRDAVVAVEGAGAPRFLAPRTATIVDLVGLSDRFIARHQGYVPAKLCHLVRKRPTHFAIPEEWLPQFTPVFRLRELARIEDPEYTQVDPPRALAVVLLAVDEIHPEWVDGCGAAHAGAAASGP